MTYSELGYSVLRIWDQMYKYKKVVPTDLYTEVIRECSCILQRLRESLMERESESRKDMDEELLKLFYEKLDGNEG